MICLENQCTNPAGPTGTGMQTPQQYTLESMQRQPAFGTPLFLGSLSLSPSPSLSLSLFLFLFLFLFFFLFLFLFLFVLESLMQTVLIGRTAVNYQYAGGQRAVASSRPWDRGVPSWGTLSLVGRCGEGKLKSRVKSRGKKSYFISSDPHRDIVLLYTCRKFWHSLR